MKTFPKKIYVTATINEEGQIIKFYVDEDLKEVADREDEDTEVSVYQLIKVGAVRKQSKVVFE